MYLHKVCAPLLILQSQIFLLFSLAQLLVQREGDLFAENENRETPCDCAEKQHHKELALCLESQMVFSLAPEAEGIEAEYAALDRREVQSNTLRGGGCTAFSLSPSTGVTCITNTKLLHSPHQVEKPNEAVNNCCHCYFIKTLSSKLP